MQRGTTDSDKAASTVVVAYTHANISMHAGEPPATAGQPAAPPSAVPSRSHRHLPVPVPAGRSTPTVSSSSSAPSSTYQYARGSASHRGLQAADAGLVNGERFGIKQRAWDTLPEVAVIGQGVARRAVSGEEPPTLIACALEHGRHWDSHTGGVRRASPRRLVHASLADPPRHTACEPRSLLIPRGTLIVSTLLSRTRRSASRA